MGIENGPTDESQREMHHADKITIGELVMGK